MPTAPYETIGAVLDLARVRVNDAIQSLAGDVLKNNQPFTLVMVNGAWRRLQAYIASLGFVRLEGDITISNLPAAANLDTNLRVSINWSGYSDGISGINTAFVLPQDLIFPTYVGERLAGTNDVFHEVDLLKKPLPKIPKLQWNRISEWHQDVLYMPGATTTTDLWIRYASYLPDFTDLTVMGGTLQPVPILRAQSAFADLIAYEMANIRAGINAAGFLASGYKGCDEIVRVPSAVTQ